MRDGFIFYESFWNAIKELPAQTQLLLYNALAGYALCDIEPDFDDDGIAKGFFTLMRPQIDANNRRREAGLRGGRPAKSAEQEPYESCGETKAKPSDNQDVTKAEPNDIQAETKAEPKEKEKANEKVKAKANEKAKANWKENSKANENGKEKSRAICADAPRRFTKPTVEDIRAYCRERGNGIDPQRFFDFYEAKGWRVGNQPMQDWQASIRTWEGREQGNARERGSTNPFRKMLQQEEVNNGQIGDDAYSGDSAGGIPEFLQGDGR